MLFANCTASAFLIPTLAGIVLKSGSVKLEAFYSQLFPDLSFSFALLIYQLKFLEMRKSILIILAAGLLFSNTAIGQDISESDVPSVLVNKFKSAYPQATDVDWEMDGELYKVEFETEGNIDHDIWYNSSGELVRHKEDIAQSELPQAVLSRVNTDFKGYTIEDSQRTTTGSDTVYKLELDSQTDEWEVTIAANGQIIKKEAD